MKDCELGIDLMRQYPTHGYVLAPPQCDGVRGKSSTILGYAVVLQESLELDGTSDGDKIFICRNEVSTSVQSVPVPYIPKTLGGIW